MTTSTKSTILHQLLTCYHINVSLNESLSKHFMLSYLEIGITKQLLHYKVLLLNIYTVLVVHPNPTCFAMQSKAMIWKEPRQLHQRKARPIRLRKRNLSLNVLVQSAANACHRVFPYTYTRGPKLYIPSTTNTWKRLYSTAIWADRKWAGFWQIILYINKKLKS